MEKEKGREKERGDNKRGGKEGRGRVSEIKGTKQRE